MKWFHLDNQTILEMPYSLVLTAIDTINEGNKSPETIEDW